MSIDIHPTSQPRTHAEPTPDTAKRRPAGRASSPPPSPPARSTALVLTLVVFAGGTEATITGSLLLGFGFGWALMAVLTARRTTAAAALGSRPGGRDGRHRRRPGGLHPRQRRP